MANSKEKQFAQHPTHKAYYATTDGEVMSFKTKVPKFIIQSPHGRGYTQFQVSLGKETKSYLTHRFVYECFYGLIDDETLQVHHIDHDKRNNALSNLALVTDWENKMHAKTAGRFIGRPTKNKKKK